MAELVETAGGGAIDCLALPVAQMTPNQRKAQFKTIF